MAVPVRIELLAYLDQQHARMSRALTTGLIQRRQRLRDMSRALPRPDSLLDSPRQRLDRASDRLARAASLTDAPKLRLERATARLDPALMAGVQRRKMRLADLSSALRPATLTRKLAQDSQRAASLSRRLAPALNRERMLQDARLSRATKALSAIALRQITTWQNQISAAERLRLTLGYEATLERGFAVIRSEGQIITSSAAAADQKALEIQFADGKIIART
jgi:exodeoxyribonuclease VII large subunit